MDKSEYVKLVEKKSKNPNILEDAFISFLSGGVLGGLYHILTTWFIQIFNVDVQTACGITCILYITVAIVLTGFGVFDTLVRRTRCRLDIRTSRLGQLESCRRVGHRTCREGKHSRNYGYPLRQLGRYRGFVRNENRRIFIPRIQLL